MNVNDTTNAVSEHNPRASTVRGCTNLDAWDDAYRDPPGEHVRVTQHAQQRFLERVSANESFPRSRIEREFREAQRVTLNDPDITDPTRLHPVSGVVYVFDPDDNTVITCFIPTEEQLKQPDSTCAGRRAVA